MLHSFGLTFINILHALQEMVLDKLGESLKGTLSKIAKAIFVDEKLVNELVKEIQRALLQSDVNVKLVFSLSKQIKERALKEEPPGGISKKEWLIKIVYEELTKFLGEEEGKLDIDAKKKPYKIMLVGLFGNGKTTTAGKLAKYFQKRGHKVALISTDTWRPAAYEQLKQTGQRITVPVFGNPKQKKAEKIYKEFEKELQKFDVVIIDTAGRDALSDELTKELNALHTAIKADQNILVIAADLGQAAEKQAQVFHETCGVNGVIITRLDGTAKGGGALAATSVTGAKVLFIGVGEKIDDLEKFRPKNFVGRLLGMGDLDALLEKAHDAISEEDAQDLGKKMLKGEFNLLDLYEQMAAMRKMGPITKLVEMIPGMGQLKLPKEMLEGQEGKLDNWKVLMQSMTKEELEDPEKVMNPSRIERISKGSGIPIGELKELLKQYRIGKKMMKQFKGGKNLDRVMRQLQSGQMKGMKFR